ncbi:hypothetical protein AMTR_s00041p00125970, partial [Amborella trichopoda]
RVVVRLQAPRAIATLVSSSMIWSAHSLDQHTCPAKSMISYFLHPVHAPTPIRSASHGLTNFQATYPAQGHLIAPIPLTAARTCGSEASGSTCHCHTSFILHDLVRPLLGSMHVPSQVYDQLLLAPSPCSNSY